MTPDLLHPTINATLNAASAVFLLVAYRAIRRLEIERHRRWMLTAAFTSAAFLISYVAYHVRVGSVRFAGVGPVRAVYFAILGSHTLLAIVIVPMAIMTLSRAFKQRFDAHKRIARWTWPLWMYVSVTGVLIYFLLYQIFPQH